MKEHPFRIKLALPCLWMKFRVVSGQRVLAYWGLSLMFARGILQSTHLRYRIETWIRTAAAS